MVFNDIDSIKQYLLNHIPYAVQKSQEQVYQCIDKFVKQYYAEYSPEVYERTYQLYKSLVKTEIQNSGNGYRTSVYFDLTNLDYQVKHMTKIVENGMYVNPYNHATSSDGTFLNTKGSAEKVMDAAAHGSHGGKVDGTAIWDEPIAILNTEAYEMLKRMLISEGIPIR